MIKIYYCASLVTDIPEEISDYRREKIIVCRTDRGRIEQIRTARALKAGFADLGIDEKNVIYAVNENGKPYAKELDGIYFSVTHTDNVSLVAFSDKEIGIDCENDDREISDAVMERFFAEAENRECDEHRLLLWVAKEAAVKQSSRGFIRGRKDTEIPYFADEISLGGIWLKRFEICGALGVICAESRDGILLKEVY